MPALACLVPALGACAAAGPGAGAQARAQSPESGPAPSTYECATDSAGSQDPGTLPRYFTVELRASELDRGQVTADGVQIGSDELTEFSRQEAESGEVRGAALVALPGVSAEQIFRVFQQISAAGFSHVLVSGLPGGVLGGSGERPISEAADPASEEAASATVEAEQPDSDAPTDEENPVPRDVVVTHMGLHIGGGPNNDASHARYSGPIERSFDEFRRCHLLAEDRTRKASFGVDLLIDTKGGRAKIKDYRTSLKGKDFHLCVLGVFGGVSFPAPERPTVVSYSILFKPQR